MIRRWVESSWRDARRSGGRLKRKVLILMYHRVAELRSDPWALGVTPRHFAQHLEVLRQHAQPLSLQQLSQALLEGDLPRRSVVVTFDDGYADNLHNAKPLLERYDFPATFFLASGAIGREREFWWDELDRMLLHPGTLPKSLSLSVSGRMYQWELGEAAHYSEDASQRHSKWRAWKEAPGPRQMLYRSLWGLLYPLTEGEQREVLDRLLVWADLEPAARPSHRSLSLEEAIALSEGGLVEVGAHTVSHPALSEHPVTLQRDEVLQSKARLEEIMDHQVTSFAYPYGAFSPETVNVVREANFTCACSTLVDVVGLSTDRFLLPRVRVPDRRGKGFAGRLSTWFSDETISARVAERHRSHRQRR